MPARTYRGSCWEKSSRRQRGSLWSASTGSQRESDPGALPTASRTRAEEARQRPPTALHAVRASEHPRSATGTCSSTPRVLGVSGQEKPTAVCIRREVRQRPAQPSADQPQWSLQAAYVDERSGPQRDRTAGVGHAICTDSLAASSPSQSERVLRSAEGPNCARLPRDLSRQPRREQSEPGAVASRRGRRWPSVPADQVQFAQTRSAAVTSRAGASRSRQG